MCSCFVIKVKMMQQGNTESQHKKCVIFVRKCYANSVTARVTSLSKLGMNNLNSTRSRDLSMQLPQKSPQTPSILNIFTLNMSPFRL